MSCGPSAGRSGAPNMIKVKRIDHVAIAVDDRDQASRAIGDLFGLCVGAREHVAAQKTDVTFLHAVEDAGQSRNDAHGQAGTDDPRDDPRDDRSDDHDSDRDATAIEIIAPARPDGNPGLARFLDRRGPGLHHICFEVDDLPGTLASLKAAGVRLIDETPRPGARGHLVAFLHPASTGGVLFELCAPANGAPA